VGRAFVLEHTTLQYRLADEFEVLEAPDILALSNKHKESVNNEKIQAETAIAMDSALEFEQPKTAVATLDDVFSI